MQESRQRAARSLGRVARVPLSGRELRPWFSPQPRPAHVTFSSARAARYAAPILLAPGAASRRQCTGKRLAAPRSRGTRRATRSQIAEKGSCEKKEPLASRTHWSLGPRRRASAEAKQGVVKEVRAEEEASGERSTRGRAARPTRCLVSGLPCNIRRAGGRSLVIGGSSLIILEERGV